MLDAAEKDILRRVPVGGSALYLDQLAVTAGIDNFAVMTGTRPVTEYGRDSLQNLMSAEPTFVEALAGADGYIDKTTLNSALEGNLANFSSLTPQQRRLVSDLLASYNALSGTDQTRGISTDSILRGSAPVTSDATAQTTDPAATTTGDGTTPSVASTGRTVNWGQEGSIYDVAMANLVAREAADADEERQHQQPASLD